MGNRIDLTGKVFGSWTVLEYVGSRKIGGKGATKPFWLCLCSCGTEREVEGASLRHGLSIGCGCTKRLAISKSRTKHGHAKLGQTSGTYWSWSAMRARVNGNNAHSKKYYQSRGISICDRWDSFENFLIDMGERPEGTSLDRFPDKNGNYEPSNCRWATDKQQANNKNNNVLIVYQGKCQSISEWANELGVNYSSIQWRIKSGETNPEKIFAVTPRKEGKSNT